MQKTEERSFPWFVASVLFITIGMVLVIYFKPMPSEQMPVTPTAHSPAVK